MRIAVTGGMGFIGHELVDLLVTEGHDVTVVDFYQDLIPAYEAVKSPILKELYRILPKCSLLDPWSFLSNFDLVDADVVVHAGAVVNTRDLGSKDLFDKNIDYTEQLVKLCDKLGSFIVFISSASVYGADGFPNNPYGLTKALGENIVKKYTDQSASLRLFNVFGKFESHKGDMASVPWQISKSLKSGNKFYLHSVEAKRDFIPSSSVVKAISNVIKDFDSNLLKSHNVFDVGTGTPTSFADLAKTIQGAIPGHQGTIELCEIPPSLIGRFQTYTCAGEHGVKNIGGIINTEEGIRRNYGFDGRSNQTR